MYVTAGQNAFFIAGLGEKIEIVYSIRVASLILVQA